MRHHESWISISLYHDQLDKLIHEVVVPSRKEVYEKKLSKKLIFNRSWAGGENIILICEVESVSDATAIRLLIEKRATAFFKQHPAPEKQIELPVNDWFLPFPNNHLHFNDQFLFDIMETGGLQASRLTPALLGHSSDAILDFIESAGEDWNVDSALGIALQFHLVFLLAFDRDIENISHFYHAFFGNMLRVTEGGDNSEHFKQDLVKGLELNFNEQKDALISFINEIISAMQHGDGEECEDEWLNEWSKCCTKFSHQIKQLQLNGEFIPPEQFVKNDEISASEQMQELWTVFEYYLRAINAQLGIENVYEINLVYSLQECTRFLSTTTEA